jgi:hypothetical protein
MATQPDLNGKLLFHHVVMKTSSQHAAFAELCILRFFMLPFFDRAQVKVLCDQKLEKAFERASLLLCSQPIPASAPDLSFHCSNSTESCACPGAPVVLLLDRTW